MTYFARFNKSGKTTLFPTLTREKISNGEADVIKELQAKGMNVTSPDRKSFLDKMQPAYDKVSDLSGKEAMKAVLDAVERAK